MNNEQQSSPSNEEVDIATRGPVLSRRFWVFLAALPVCAWLGWMTAMHSGAMKDYQRLQGAYADMQSELEEARLQLQQVEVDLLVARQAVTDGQELVSDLEQQLFRQQQDLAQYQGALAPSALLPGVRIQAFELLHTDFPGVFLYKVMVSRVGNENDTIDAQLHMTLKGQKDGGQVSLSLKELTAGRVESLPLNFRYFQVVPDSDGADLVLPSGFEPDSIELKVEHEGQTLLEQSLPWEPTSSVSGA